MRIAIVTDAWSPQVNGVVRTLQSIRAELIAQGHDVLVVSPDLYPSLPCPTYPEIRLAFVRSRSVGKRIADFCPDAVHLSTEGPLCLAARRWCLRHSISFTTAYHTQFPDYVSQRTGMPASWIWPYIRWFHAPARRVLVSTPSIRRMLASHGVAHTAHWSRGVNLENFTSDAPPPAVYASLPRPIQLYVGRVAVEKNIDAFLKSQHPGSKVVVGHGPALSALKLAYPDVNFLGSQSGKELAGAYAGADVFVFPSRTDTFGLVMIEAMACGLPVAAYPVSGPIDVVTPQTGALHPTLETAIAQALVCKRSACAAHGTSFTWEASARQFLEALFPLGDEIKRIAA